MPEGALSRRAKRREVKLARRRKQLADMGYASGCVVFMDHHLCHAAAAYHGWGRAQDQILVVTADGAGDGLCATVRMGQHGRLEDPLVSVQSQDSVAIIYGLITHLLGFVPLEHEYKLMGLAPYAADSKQSRCIADYFHSLFRVVPGSPPAWSRAEGVRSTFDLGPTLARELRFQRFDHIAAGVQTFTEELMVEWLRGIVRHFGVPRLALSGGIFMNVKMNKLIGELPEVESLFVFPSCGDESNSLGAAWAAWAAACREAGRETPLVPCGPAYWGADFGDADMDQALAKYRFAKQVSVTPCDDIERRCAELLAQGEVVARCKGRMEFGARALGNRSILANPSRWDTVHTINAMVKKRDFWMPFAPSILAEQAGRYLINPKNFEAPHMILAFDSVAENRQALAAAIHPYDKSCRPQVVRREQNPDYHRLIDAYSELTGHGAILNTSFNLHGSPIVYRPEEAMEVFDRSGLRFLALGDVMVEQVGGS